MDNTRDIESKATKQKLLIINRSEQKIVTLDGVNKIDTGFERIKKVIAINCQTCSNKSGYLQCLSCKDFNQWEN